MRGAGKTFLSRFRSRRMFGRSLWASLTESEGDWYKLPLCESSEEGERRVALIIVNEGESIESALRRFKRKVQQEDIIKEIKKHSFYLKPGERRRLKEALARKRLRRRMRREMGE